MQPFRQNGDKGHRIFRGHELHSFLTLFSLQKAGGHQLFQNPGAGGRGSQTFSLGILRHIFLPGSFHRRKQRILGEMFGRAGFALLDGSAGKGQRLTLGQFWQTASVRQGLVLGFLVRLRIFQRRTVGSVQCPPAGVLHRFALGGKLRTGTLHSDSSF